MGWVLGRNSAALSYADPIAKYNKRVLEIADARAPLTVASLKYDERAASVLSYVAFAFPPYDIDIGRLEYQAKHKLLRHPPQPMSYALRIEWKISVWWHLSRLKTIDWRSCTGLHILKENTLLNYLLKCRLQLETL